MKRVCFGAVFAAVLFVSVARGDVAGGLALLNDGDVSSAAQAFAEAYDAGEADGAFYLGRLFEMGLGTEQDEMRAANLYAAGAEKGSSRAQARLGLMYHEGRVLLRNYAEGTRLLCAAAAAGDPDGQLNCGLALQAGRGIDKDEQRGLALIEQAAGQGSVLALNVLGQHYLSRGDTEAAAKHLLNAADRGNALAMYEYARVEASKAAPDDETAYMYASLAVVRGLPAAGTLLDELEARMTAEAVAGAQDKARAWTEARVAEAAQE
ncbi:tetratricopeptide repeat protein [Halovulum sp. GXIMD14793]